MEKTLELKLKIESWDENPYRELDDGRKFTRADVVLSGEQASASFEALMFYRADGTGRWVTLMQVTTAEGGFLLEGTGGFDGTTAEGVSQVVAGSGTGGFAGMSGSARTASTHADYPYMPLTLTYDLP